MDSERVTITRDDNQFVISDEDGEFARAGDVESALSYVRDLLYGPGTVKPLPAGLDISDTAFGI